MSPKYFRMTLALFCLTLFVNAWLLFWLQPLVAKMILPTLGGTPNVWNACMMFFQGMLLAGYFYAHLSAKYCPIKAQPLLHIVLLCLGVAFLPIGIHPNWLPNSEAPVTSLVTLLTSMIFLPSIALNAGSPLLQRWFFATDHPEGQDPYFLFSISSIGCLFALLAFPLIFEPTMTISHQNTLWAAFFVLLILLSAACGIVVFRYNTPNKVPSRKHTHSLPQIVTLKDKAYWLLLSLAPSSLLLGVTTHITTDIASVPLLWMVPLILYFIAFIIGFSARPLISPKLAQTLLVCGLFPFAIIMLYKSDILHHIFMMFFHLFLFFFICLVLIFELVKRRPDPIHLTEYYLWIALGGFLGGAFNTLLAPLIFNDITEYPMMVVFAMLLKTPEFIPKNKFKLGCVIFVIVYFLPLDTYHQKTIYTVRNFFGTSRVANFDNQVHVLLHGTTVHGLQIMLPHYQKDILSYYKPLISVFDDLHKLTPNLSAGFVGLGAGITACLAQPNDAFTFYEINPAVIKIAKNTNYFTFLKLCPPTGGIIVGDARLKLQSAEDHQYDVLLLDAFSSDSIPIHLMTKEAIELYLRKLKDHGIILLHISNRYLDLKPVASAVSQSTHLYGIYQQFDANIKKLTHVSIWVILTQDKFLADWFISNRGWKKLPSPNTSDLWTDDYSNIIRVINIQ